MPFRGRRLFSFRREGEFMNAQRTESTNSVRASVCMATYKGSEFVGEQIASILAQLGPTDELIIVDDASPDNTVDVIRHYTDRRIRLYAAPKNQGYVRSFERAVLSSSGQYIIFSDQDDIWVEGRLEAMLKALAETDVVATNFAVLGGGSRGNVPLLRSADSDHYIRNLIGIMVGYRPYYGCTMGMTRAQADIFTPIPAYIRESHDLWLAVCGNVSGSMTHLEEPTLLRRLHADNVTPRGWRSLPTILAARIMLLRCVVEAITRKRRAGLRT